jgi:hypothetical protein
MKLPADVVGRDLARTEPLEFQCTQTAHIYNLVNDRITEFRKIRRAISVHKGEKKRTKFWNI